MTQSPIQALRVAVVQDGARLHYAVPLALLHEGALGVMFSEWFIKRRSLCAFCSRFVGSNASANFRSLVGRRCDHIPPNLVRVNPLLALWQRWNRRRFAIDEEFYTWSSRGVGNWVLRHGIEDANALFGFIRNIDPRICREYHGRGLFTVGDQMIAPASVEAREARIQCQRWPNWEPARRQHDFALVSEVERNTWKHLTRITCASDYVRRGLLEEGIEDRNIHILPYPIDAGSYAVADRRRRRGPLVVGFVGAVGLRKGTPYFLQVARRLAADNLRFVMVGGVEVSDQAISPYKNCVEFVGRVQRSQVASWLDRFDLFFFPSTCEGSAGSVMEAMACGLPIVTSPSSGTIVREGIDGFVRDYDNIDELAACVERLAGDEELRLRMGTAARQHAEEISLATYGRRLIEVFRS